MPRTSIFHRDGERVVPTAHAVGPWDPGALHGGAPAALAARAVEALAPQMRLARLTLEFLGAVPLAPLAVTAAIARPGRRFQVAEVEIAAGDRAACRGRAMLLRRGEVTGLPDDHAAPLDVAGPDGLERFAFGEGESFASTGMDVRFARGHLLEPGPAFGWLRLDRPLLDDEPPSPAARAVGAADFGSGVSSVLDWNRWLFVNTDLTVHLRRDPVGEWVGLDSRTVLEPDGSGLTSTALHDARGPVGVALQSLFVDLREP